MPIDSIDIQTKAEKGEALTADEADAIVQSLQDKLNEVVAALNSLTNPSFNAISGSPTDNTALASALGGFATEAQLDDVVADVDALQGGGAEEDVFTQFLVEQGGIVIPNAYGATSWTALGAGSPVAGSTTSAATAVSNDFSTAQGHLRLIEYPANSAAAGTQAAIRPFSTQPLSPRAPRGLRAAIIPAFNDANGGAKFFAGLVDSSTELRLESVEPSAVAGRAFIALGADSTDTYLQLMHRDGSAAATKINLGASFPKTGTQAYLVEITQRTPQVLEYEVVITNLSTEVKATHTLSTNLPVLTSSLYYQVIRCNGSSATATSVRFGGFAFGKSSSFFINLGGGGGGGGGEAYVPPVVVADAATITLNAGAFPAAQIGTFRIASMAGNRVFAAPSSPTDGQTIRVKWRQDGNGNKVPSFAGGAGGWHPAGGVEPGWAMLANAWNQIEATYDSAMQRWVYASVPTGVI